MGTFLKWVFYITLVSFVVYLVGVSIYNPSLIKLNFFMLLGLAITPMFVLLFKKFTEKHRTRMFRILDAIEYVEGKNEHLSQDEIIKILFLADLKYYQKYNSTFFLIFWFIQGEQVVSKVASSHFETESRLKFKEKNADQHISYSEKLYPILDEFIYLTTKKLNDTIFNNSEYLQKLRESEKLSLVMPQLLIKKEQEVSEKFPN